MPLIKDLRDMELFCAIIKEGNFTAAGKKMKLSKSRVSECVSRLEATLQQQLFIRTSRRMEITRAGERFHFLCQEVLENANKIEELLVGSAEPEGKLRVTLPVSFAEAVIGPRISEFIEQYPKISLDFVVSNYVVNLFTDNVDVAVRHTNLKNESVNLEARKLMDDEHILCASSSYIKKHGMPETPKDIKKHKCIVLQGHDIWRFVSKDSKNPISIKIKEGVVCDDTEFTNHLLLGGSGLAEKSSWLVKPYLESGEVVPVLEDYPIYDNTGIYILYPKTRFLPLKVRVFSDFIEKIVEEANLTR